MIKPHYRLHCICIAGGLVYWIERRGRNGWTSFRWSTPLACLYEAEAFRIHVEST